MICGECDAHYEDHEKYAGKPLHAGYCNTVDVEMLRAMLKEVGK